MKRDFNTAILLQPDLLHTLRRFLSGQDSCERVPSGSSLRCFFLVLRRSDWSPAACASSHIWIWPGNVLAKHCQCCLDSGEAAVSVRDGWGNSVVVTLPRRLAASRHPRHGENDAGNPSNTTKCGTAPDDLFASRGMLRVFSMPKEPAEVHISRTPEPHKICPLSHQVVLQRPPSFLPSAVH
jgi:hypothetical protein